MGLYRLRDYGARCALANSRLRASLTGASPTEMKRRSPDGKTHRTMTGTAMLKKLTALIPPMWSNLTPKHRSRTPWSLRAGLTSPLPAAGTP